MTQEREKQILSALHCVILALQDTEPPGERDYEQIVTLALQYGSSLKVEKSDVEAVLRQPISKLLNF